MKLDRFNEETDRLVSESMNNAKRAVRLEKLSRRRRNIVAFSILYVVVISVLLLLYARWRGIDDDSPLTIDGVLPLLLLSMPVFGAMMNYRDVSSSR